MELRVCIIHCFLIITGCFNIATNMGSTGGKNNSNSNNEHHLGSLANTDTSKFHNQFILKLHHFYL
jgi:hypothetical protein